MLLLLHIIVALSSLVAVSFAYAGINRLALRIATVLGVGTFLSGSLLIVMAPSHLLSACLVGLGYFTILSFGVVLTRAKLAQLN